MANPTLVQHLASSSEQRSSGSPQINAVSFYLPNPVLAGNCLILGLNWATDSNNPTTATVAITDTSGDIWPAAAVQTGDGNATTSAIYVLPNARAGIHRLTINFGVGSPNTGVKQFQYQISEYYNLATVSPVNGTVSTGSTSSPNLATGSFTPTSNNDANGGNLIWAMFADQVLGPTMPTDYVAGGSFDLLSTVPCLGCASHTQAWVQATQAAVNPGATLTGGGTDGYNGVAVALKAASAGTAPSGMRIVHLTMITRDTRPTAWTVRFPSSGNLVVVNSFPNNQIPISSITDTASNTYTDRSPAVDAPQFWVAQGATTSATLKLTINSDNTNPNSQLLLYDIAGADSSAYDGNVAFPSSDDLTGANLTNTPSFTPVSVGLTLAALNLGLGPSSAVSSPPGSIFDNMWYAHMGDGDLTTFGNGRAHLFNSDLSTQNWNWTVTNDGTETQYSASAIHLKGNLAFVAATSDEPLGCFDPQQVVKAWFDEELVQCAAWFDAELLGPVTIYETKGAFSAEEPVKGWFDEELSATRNWFDVELPVPATAGFDPSTLPWPGILPESFVRPSWNPARTESARAGWTQSIWAIPPTKPPEPVQPEATLRPQWNPERSETTRAGWTQSLWAIAPQKIPEPVLPERRLLQWNPERSDVQRPASIQSTWAIPPTKIPEPVAPQRQARPPWDPERSHSVGIAYLPPTWPTTVVAPERFARALWTPERTETPRAGWTQSLWAVPPTFIPEPVLPQAFPRIWTPERSQAVWNPLQIFVVPTWAYEVYGPQALLRTAWNPERSHLSRAAWTQALWAVPPTKTPDPVLPEFYARPGWFPDRGQTLWNPFQFAAVTVPVWGYEVLGPQVLLRGAWNPERSGLARAGWTQAIWAVAPTKIPDPLLPEFFPRLWNPERSALAWTPFSTIPVFGYEVHGPQIFLRALWNPERGDLARAGWTQALWAVAPTKIPEPVLPHSFARQIWTPERSHHSSIALIIPAGPVPISFPERFPPLWIPERSALVISGRQIVGPVSPLSWTPKLLDRFVQALRASPHMDLFAPALTTVIVPVFGPMLFGRRDLTELMGRADFEEIAMFAAAATDGSLATSFNGLTWTTRSAPSASRWHAMTWNGSIFCMIADSSADVATSPDGITWTLGAMPSVSSWRDVAWNGSVFCAVAADGHAATSPDGLIWTAQTIPAGVWQAIAWNGSVFCAVASGAAATSPDGITWTAQAIGAGLWNGIAWNGSVFCAVKQSSSVSATSPDGVTWTPQTMPFSGNWFDVAWNGSVFCAIAFNNNRVATSPDGVTWTSRTVPLQRNWHAIAWNGSFFSVIADSSSSAMVSADGVNWTLASMPSNTFWDALAAGRKPGPYSSGVAGAQAIGALKGNVN